MDIGTEHSQNELERRIFHLKTLYDVSQEIGFLRDTRKIIKNLLMMVMGNFGALCGVIALVDIKKGKIEAVTQRGMDKTSIDLLSRAMESVSFKEIKGITGIQIWIPFEVNEDLKGGIGLGDKLSGDPYTSDDQELLSTIANQAAVAIQNAVLYEQVKEYAEELEAKVEARTRELQQVNKELEAFSYSVSHDLRAPLRSIDGFSQALLEDHSNKLDAVGKGYLQRVRAATQRMAQLIDAMLTLSRVTRREMRHETVDLSALAKAIAEEIQNTQPERQVEFVIQEGLVANGDVRLLRAVLENLLGNAWKFTGKRPYARIEFGAAQHDGKPAYFIRDNGAGFDMAYADKLFGAFKRLHSVADFDGTGIGLATVQRIIHRHGGCVWAESAVEQGATFYFTL